MDHEIEKAKSASVRFKIPITVRDTAYLPVNEVDTTGIDRLNDRF